MLYYIFYINDIYTSKKHVFQCNYAPYSLMNEGDNHHVIPVCLRCAVIPFYTEIK